jgi:hypothetical protein
VNIVLGITLGTFVVYDILFYTRINGINGIIQ